MDRYDALTAWATILSGRKPLLSIEITKECPLRCPGCYAYDSQHLGGEQVLRDLADEKGDRLVEGVLELVDRLRPLHLSIVGGDPLVRYRELEVLLPQLADRGIYVQLVTSAFREIPQSWSALPNQKIVVSIDGLPPEHDERRKPATYERILKNIAGRQVTIHCTLTGNMLRRSTYLEEFLAFWSAREEAWQIWISLFTPQLGAEASEILTRPQREFVVRELLRLKPLHPKLDMKDEMIRHFLNPPSSPKTCVFAQATETISADLKTRITPCQFGGKPDCAQCGCAASMGLNALASIKLAPGLQVRRLFNISNSVGAGVKRLRAS
jgi:MoaA/NifB/PqqE/SkfB family radical SAM enzyme